MLSKAKYLLNDIKILHSVQNDSINLSSFKYYGKGNFVQYGCSRPAQEGC